MHRPRRFVAVLATLVLGSALFGAGSNLFGVGVENTCSFSIEVRSPAAADQDWQRVAPGEQRYVYGEAANAEFVELSFRSEGDDSGELSLTPPTESLERDGDFGEDIDRLLRVDQMVCAELVSAGG